jgi:putative hydrolase of the HAD superfamily
MTTSDVCVVFDVDDTLYLERDYVRSGFDAVGRWAAESLNVSEFSGRCWSRFCDGGRGSIFNDVLIDCGVEATAETIAALVECYRTHQPAISLAADAQEAIAALVPKHPLAVITDGPAASQSRKVEALGLPAIADPVILTDTLGGSFSKPHPRAFEMVAARRPARAYVYVADNPVKDFTAPKALGWVTVRVRRPEGLHYSKDNQSAVPDFEMPNCQNLPAVISHL